ncbi:hypothetical protein PIB30_066217 [Stylosanthes scabra]|uniref:Putative plant transposon protein domain-containing protein n=1 Tax=Stylosanthes scabra TaxID=79078 RepID=A0ABU6ZL18_9FABA|nr:hypothetical protein [Stylosanthes scabra]
MVREFCSNFSAAHQTHVFLRGKRIQFSEDDIRRFLGIDIDFPPLGEDDMYKMRVAARKNDSAILNAQATAWHKLIIANIFPKQHGTTFDMNHAILIYVLMTEGVVNLPRIMRDVLLKRPTGNSRNLLPYVVFIARLASRYQVPKFPRDGIYNIREQDMYCPYRDWKGEQPKVSRGRLILPPLAPPVKQAEQHPPSPPPQPATSEIPASSVRRPLEPSLREIMRCLRRQERLQLNTQSMLRDAFPDTTFRNLLLVTSSEDDSNAES